MNKHLIASGFVLIAAGCLWPWLRRIPWGRLPGDITIIRDNVQFFFPLSTSILLSLVLSLLVWFFRK